MYNDDQLCPVDFNRFEKEQHTYDQLQVWLKDGHDTKKFDKIRIGKTSLRIYNTKNITNNEYKIYAGEALREELVEWYHDKLIHPGDFI